MALRNEMEEIRNAVRNILTDPDLDVEKTNSVLGKLSSKIASLKRLTGEKVDRQRRQNTDINTRINQDATDIGDIEPDVEEL